MKKTLAAILLAALFVTPAFAAKRHTRHHRVHHHLRHKK
jgi:ABC-type Mn2+/Zn2+ transport system permease subunit